METSNYPLHGVRILDMATVFAGPFSATLCGDLGAEVVKLELPGGGDGIPLFWKTANRGKKGISLDVRHPEGRALFFSLIREFDVLVENFRTGTMDKWGLDLATLHEHNPRLIVLRVTGFGQTGPYARRPGFARIFESMSGFANLTGELNGPPQHMNYPLGDAIAGLFGAFAISAALAERNALPAAQQKGVEIDLSATEAMLRLLDPLAAEYRYTGQARTRTGSRATYTAPSNVYKTADGQWVTLVGTGDAIFARVCRAIGQPDLAFDPRFVTNADRVANLSELDRCIEMWFRSLPYPEIVKRLGDCEVPFSKIYSIADVEADPHFQARGAIVELQDPELGTVPAPAPVPRYVGRAQTAITTGPETGQHNREIYARLGLDDAQLEALRAAGVI
jgi:crotonobetainyl-CoA:carnitine CoA-transferase CaiB-like acyl-CoA transferase